MRRPFKKSSPCPSCGQPVNVGVHFCPNCGAAIELGASTTATPESPPLKSGRKRWTLIALGVLIVAAIGVGAALKTSHDNKVERERAAAAATQKRRAAKQAKYDSCSASQSEVISALNDVSARLDVGLNMQEYSKAVGDASVAYREGDPGELDVDCLGDVAVPVEAALNQYIKAARRWNKCIQDIDCDVDSIDLQSYWTRASSKTADAESGLAAMAP